MQSANKVLSDPKEPGWSFRNESVLFIWRQQAVCVHALTPAFSLLSNNLRAPAETLMTQLCSAAPRKLAECQLAQDGVISGRGAAVNLARGQINTD